METRLEKVKTELAKIPRKAHGHFVKTTPFKTGNARRKTVFNNPDTINADYPYANRLNEGWSRQATEGMTKPTIDYIRNEIRKI